MSAPLNRYRFRGAVVIQKFLHLRNRLASERPMHPRHKPHPKDSDEQMSMFDDNTKRLRRESVEDAVESIRSRFGRKAITYAALLGDLKMPIDGRDKVRMPRMMYR